MFTQSLAAPDVPDVPEVVVRLMAEGTIQMYCVVISNNLLKRKEKKRKGRKEQHTVIVESLDISYKLQVIG